jgi:general L-amino acid transport system substrate-binding protein
MDLYHKKSMVKILNSAYTIRNEIMKKLCAFFSVGVSLLASHATAAPQSPTLERVLDTGVVRCSADQTPGFGAITDTGQWQGFDIDFCRAVAAAVLGDPNAIEIQRISTKNKFKALTTHQVDIVLGMTTWTLSRDAGYDVNFTGTLFYDGQGFLAWQDSGITHITPETQAKICVQHSTTSEKNIEEFIKQKAPRLEIVRAASSDERRARFLQRECELTTGDKSGLAGFSVAMAPKANAFMLLPDTISREPLSPLVADDDQQWFDIVKWVGFALIYAEDMGITQNKAAELRAISQNPEVKRFLGVDADLHLKLGLSADWAYNIVRYVGNYGEIYQRNVGAQSPLHIPRGLNALHKDGGVLYAPAFR